MSAMYMVTAVTSTATIDTGVIKLNDGNIERLPNEIKPSYQPLHHNVNNSKNTTNKSYRPIWTLHGAVGHTIVPDPPQTQIDIEQGRTME